MTAEVLAVWREALKARFGHVAWEGILHIILGGAGGLAFFYFATHAASLQAEVGAIMFSAIFAVSFAQLARWRHFFWLWSLQPHSTVWRLAGLHRIAGATQRALNARFTDLKVRLVTLLDSGRLETATYEQQMAFAQLFYAAHTRRIWATSLDPWSQFGRTNEGYSRTMTVSATSAGAGVPPPDTPPPRARIFILPADRFVQDVTSDPSAARELVRQHFAVWDIHPRLMLIPPSCPSAWEEMITSCSQAADPLAPKIPDFMLVDDRFVYGRMTPEILEDKVPLLRSSFTLGFTNAKRDTLAYERLFLALWCQSLSIDQFAAEVIDSLEGRCPSPAPGHRSALLGVAAVGEQASTRLTLQQLLTNTRGDINDFLAVSERRRRYPGFIGQARGKMPIGLLFRHKMAQADGPCYAIDQADRQDPPVRFPSAWQRPEYRPWREAFARRTGSLRRRIFVVEDWQFGDDPWLETFLMTEVVGNGVAVGVIQREDFKHFALRTRGLDAADHDAQWIIANADARSGIPRVVDVTIGLTLGTSPVRRDFTSNTMEVEFKEEDLIVDAKLDAYLKWHEAIWERAGDTLWKLHDEVEVKHFVAMVRSRTRTMPELVGAGAVPK